MIDDMMGLLRRVVPTQLFDFTAKNSGKDDPYYIVDLSSAASKADIYAQIVEDCNKALSIHIYLSNLISNRMDMYGDCWNISSICAEALQVIGKPATLFTFTDDEFIYHAEVAIDLGNGEYRYMYVEPFNEFPTGSYKFTLSPAMGPGLWEFIWCVHVKLSYGNSYNLRKLHFHNQGAVNDGMGVRERIRDVYANYPMPVKLIDLTIVRRYLDQGRYYIVNEEFE